VWSIWLQPKSICPLCQQFIGILISIWQYEAWWSQMDHTHRSTSLCQEVDPAKHSVLDQ
jgi:hypothetical protein